MVCCAKLKLCESCSDFNLLIDVQDMNPLSANLFWIRNKKTGTESTSDSDRSGERYDFGYHGILASTSRHLRNEGIAKTKSKNADFVVNNRVIEVHFKR